MRGHECEFGAEEWGSFLKESKLSIDLKSMMRESWQDYIAVLQGVLQGSCWGCWRGIVPITGTSRSSRKME